MEKHLSHHRPEPNVVEGEIVSGRGPRIRVIKFGGLTSWLLLIAFLIIGGLLLALILKGVGWIAALILPVLLAGTVAVTAVLLVAGLPLAVIARTRPVAVAALYLGAFSYGLTAWILGFVLTLEHWGVFWLIIGLLLAGVGVVPMGLLASGFVGDWQSFWVLLALVGLGFGARLLGRRLAFRL